MDYNNIWVIVILGVFLVAMIVMTIIPQKKRQKQQQEMMNSLSVGTKIMTIGRLVGKIVSINTAENSLVINVGTDSNPTLITIEKNGVGVVLDGIKPIENTPVETSSAAPVEELKQEIKDEPVVPVAPEETKSAAPAKKKAAPAKKAEKAE